MNDFKIDGKWARSVGGTLTYSYQIWYSMMQRCIPGGRIQKLYKTYDGCHTSELFSDFDRFADWLSVQPGYQLPDYDLDKDLLFDNNKLYSEDTCVLIPHALNTFFIATRDRELPQGVSAPLSRFGTKKPFKAQLRVDGEIKYLGMFPTAEAAFSAYKVAKEAHARQWAERLAAGEFIVDPRVIDRMRVWTVPSK
jgi:hypothetical protein